MADTAKRTVLTPEQRVAKLEAELAAAKAKAEAKAQKQIDELVDRRTKLMARIEKLNGQIAGVDNELAALGYEFVPEQPQLYDVNENSNIEDAV